VCVCVCACARAHVCVPWFLGDIQPMCFHMELNVKVKCTFVTLPMCTSMCGAQTISQIHPCSALFRATRQCSQSGIGATSGVAVLFGCVTADRGQQ
jgi:hypothetical protein